MTPAQNTVLKWLFGKDIGASSEALAAEYFGIEMEHYSHPRDPSDLGRCLRLIALVPEIRACVDSLAKKSDEWKALAPIWDKLANTMEKEVGIDWSKGRIANNTWNLMQALRNAPSTYGETKCL